MNYGADSPSAESLVSWLLEHQEVQIAELSDSDSLFSSEDFSDSESDSDDMPDIDGAFGEVSMEIILGIWR